MPTVAATKNSVVRLKDIAERLNVSVSTVSRALGKETSRLVAPELRKKINELALETRYVPHPAAQLMRKPNIHLITVLLPFDSGIFLSDYYGTVLSGVISASRELGTETRLSLISNEQEDGEVVEQMQRVAIGAGGLFYTADPLRAEDLAKIEDFGRPVVVMSGCLPPNIELSSIRVSTVGSDNVTGAYQITKELLGMGHQRIGLVNGPAMSRDASEREQGFLKAMKEHNGIIDPRAMTRVQFSADAGMLGWQQIKRCVPLPTAVVCGNDAIAFGVLESLAQDKIGCPGQMSVVGFDDARGAVHVTPKLTTVRQSIAQLGRAATEILIRQLQTGDEPEVEHLVFPTEIVRRQSAAPPSRT
ncbi:MAG TPA: LacI family DNA-binding transcriptional regulator [Verrucomicrobiae bacterium]|nr:LacI family DNA-binding transcriptional regulator [Verrucomicrobiae bacterium]